MKYILCLLLIGCNPAFDETCREAGKVTVEHQAEATELVWNLYGGKGTPPRVFWHHKFECLNEAEHEDGECVNGYYLSRCNSVKVAIYTDKIFWSSFSHELFHSYLYQSTGDADGDHLSSDWEAGYGHPEGGKVQQAMQALFDKGW